MTKHGLETRRTRLLLSLFLYDFPSLLQNHLVFLRLLILLQNQERSLLLVSFQRVFLCSCHHLCAVCKKVTPVAMTRNPSSVDSSDG